MQQPNILLHCLNVIVCTKEALLLSGPTRYCVLSNIIIFFDQMQLTSSIFSELSVLTSWMIFHPSKPFRFSTWMPPTWMPWLLTQAFSPCWPFDKPLPRL